MDELKAPNVYITPQGQPQSPVSPEAPAQAPKAEAKDPAAEARFAHLARKERQLRQQARQLDQQRKAFEEASKPKAAPPPSIDDFKSKLLEDPTSLGLTYDQLANLVLNQGNPQDQTLRALQREIASLRSAQDQAQKSAQETQEKSYQQALKQVERDVRKAIDNNKEFETIKASGQHEAVVSLIEQTFKEDGVLLGVEEAAQAIEEQLLEHAVSLARLEKVQAKLTPTQVAAQAEETPKGPQSELQAALEKKQATDRLNITQKSPLTTLTNRLQTSVSTGKAEHDRVARAIAAMQQAKK